MATIREGYEARILAAGGKLAAKQSVKYRVYEFKQFLILLGKSGAFRISRGKLTESISVNEHWLERAGI